MLPMSELPYPPLKRRRGWSVNRRSLQLHNAALIVLAFKSKTSFDLKQAGFGSGFDFPSVLQQ